MAPRFFYGRHPECSECKHFKPDTSSVHCLGCGAGEFFEEKIDDHTPDDEELMEMFSHMGNSDYE